MSTKKLFYIYSYNNGIRLRNVGFVELRNKGSKYRVMVSMRIPQEYLAENMNICLYKLEKGEMNQLKLGTLKPLNESCRFSTTIDEDELEERGFSIDEISGMYISSKEHDRYVFWADMELDYMTKRELQYV